MSGPAGNALSMPAPEPRVANFLIGGTEKAGTTSVYTYLSEHPEVCVSSRKETDFFRREYTGHRDRDLAGYARYFAGCGPDARIVMEASPGYLGEAERVAVRIAGLLDDVKLLFILRDPIERLYSSYHFHVGKLNIPEDLRFEDYVAQCIAWERGESADGPRRLDDWYLSVMRFGRYADFLEIYLSHFPRERLEVMFFEDLKSDPLRFMIELSRFLGIDEQFWRNYEFRRSNVTFSGKHKGLHRLAMFLNERAEPWLRRRPRLKARLVDLYKSVNQARQGYDPMTATARATLQDYYRDTNRRLEALLDRDLPADWTESADGAGERGR